MFKSSVLILAAVLAAGSWVSPTSVDAALVQMDFRGNAGFGLLPGNEPTPPNLSTPAIGGETGNGLVYDTDTRLLAFSFGFSNLTGGLTNAAGGIHLHLVPPTATDPFSVNGPVVFILNQANASNVTLTTPLVPIGSTGGDVAGTVLFTPAQEVDLFAGRFYLNIHSAQFPGGELRGNITAVPEPSTCVLLAAGCLAPIVRRRFKKTS